jgi:DNA polymerase III epsilon subunit-like protein
MERSDQMKLPKYLAFDTETGGIDLHFSLLSAYFAALDEDFNLVAELDLKTKPDDGIYVVSAGGMKVNKIDLVAHDEKAVTYKQAATAIYDFVKLHSQQGKNKLIPIGHNVHFDIDQILDKTLTKKNWEIYVGYRKMDTGGTSLYLMDAGIIPQMSASLETLATYFNAPVFEAHTAKGDTHATIHVMKEMIRIGRFISDRVTG